MYLLLIRWKRTSDDSWISVLSKKVWILKQDENHLLYKVYDKGFGLTEKPYKNSVKRVSLISDSGNADCIKVSAGKSIKDEFLNPELYSETEKTCNVNEEILKDYFQLHVSTSDLYKQWESNDPHFTSVGSGFSGIRVLRQDPVENVFSFICSSNNNITR